ncbi:tyrosine-type recombinase/integrase [Methylotuvimicrobium sp. KM1]|uniref:tyrosine-type recombinase/integrase n=1 Tax=Methylotuvimicrobium sp. KM1 TaxID=3377707 RepID=UPI00384EE402
MNLTDIEIKNAQAADKPYKLHDGQGLYVLVHSNKSKYFRIDYSFAGKRKTLALGTYPRTRLKEAREKAYTVKKQLEDGIDPSLVRRLEKAGIKENTFKAVANEFLEANSKRWSEAHRNHIQECFDRDVYPWLGDRPLKDLSAIEVLTVLRRIVDRGALETAARTKQFIGQAIRYGIAHGKAERDVTQDLRGALPSPVKGHYAAIKTPKELGQLLRDIHAYKGSFIVRTALQIQPLVFARPANLVMMEWSELDLDLAEWRIPGEKMKMKTDHIVPLAKQALELLREIQPLTGHRQYVFYSPNDGHISRETIGATIRRMGYTGKHTAHGFRTTASTILHEQGFHSDMIERQLAHAERNAVKAAYNHAQYLPERRRMMQAWADYLDALRKGADVIPIRKSV